MSNAINVKSMDILLETVDEVEDPGLPLVPVLAAGQGLDPVAGADHVATHGPSLSPDQDLDPEVVDPVPSPVIREAGVDPAA